MTNVLSYALPGWSRAAHQCRQAPAIRTEYYVMSLTLLQGLKIQFIVDAGTAGSALQHKSIPQSAEGLAARSERA